MWEECETAMRATQHQPSNPSANKHDYETREDETVKKPQNFEHFPHGSSLLQKIAQKNVAKSF